MKKGQGMAASSFLSHEVIVRKIYLIRGKKVMLDRDLAELYEVETRVLNQAVRRNLDRFPDDFMFPLSRTEIRNLSQFVISLRHAPNVFAFTEQGVAMLSSILNSTKAVHVNIEIIRTFARLREFILSHRDLQKKVEELERRMNASFRSVFQAIKELEQPLKKRSGKEIGFHTARTHTGPGQQGTP